MYNGFFFLVLLMICKMKLKSMFYTVSVVLPVRYETKRKGNYHQDFFFFPATNAFAVYSLDVVTVKMTSTELWSWSLNGTSGIHTGFRMIPHPRVNNFLIIILRLAIILFSFELLSLK